MLVFPTRTRRSALVALLSLLVVVALPGVATAKVLTKPTWLSEGRDHRVLPRPRVVVRRRPGADAGPQPQEPRSTGSTPRAASRWRVTASASTAASTTSTRSARAAGSPSAAVARSSAAAASSPRSGAPPATGRTAAARVTFPLDARRLVRRRGQEVRRRRATSPSPPARRGRCATTAASRSIPTLIPLGSLVYVPAYKPLNKDGWFRADDTGGAIKGRHIDVYRRPPDSLVRQRPLPAGPPHLRRPARRTSRPTCATARASAGALPAIPRRLLRAPAR